MSGDEHMIEAFESGEDIHRKTASQVFNVPFDEVTPELRSAAKAVNFGIIYGKSDFKIIITSRQKYKLRSFFTYFFIPT